MLTKKTTKNQLTLPAALLKQLPETEYFEASVEDGAIVLRPVAIVPMLDVERLRDKIQAAGVSENDIEDAIRWARRKK